MDIPLFATLAALAACWSQFRAILDRFRSFFIQRHNLEGRVATAVQDYLFAKARLFRWGDTSITSRNVWVRPLAKRMEVAVEKAPISPVVTLWQRRLFLFQAPRHNEVSGISSSDSVISIWTLRGTLDVNRLIHDALAWLSLQETTGRRYRVHNVSGRPFGGKNMIHGSAVEVPDNRYPTSISSSEERPGIRYLHHRPEEIGEPTATDP